MSTRTRIFRFFKSLRPTFGESNLDPVVYQWEDAKAAINELGMEMEMEPDHLAYLLSKNTILDDFVGRLTQMEDKFGEKLLTREKVIDPRFMPEAEMVDEYLRITIYLSGRRRVLAEYEMP